MKSLYSGEYVLQAPPDEVPRVHALLAKHGLRCTDHPGTKNRRLIRVPADDAARAREILRAHFPGDAIVSATDMLDYCYACGGKLSLGAIHCSRCNALVGDPHGR
jgi:hypothetical protein